MKENLYTKHFPFTYKYFALNEKPPITKENLCIFFFVIGGVESIDVVLIPLMVIVNVTWVFNTYSYGGHNNQLGNCDIYFVDANNTYYCT